MIDNINVAEYVFTGEVDTARELLNNIPEDCVDQVKEFLNMVRNYGYAAGMNDGSRGNW